ncbi:hypothetical protein BT96DRAFT_998434 [Gymnopus androsaceus JB14]|uniref:Uncharacterized protein n=1 Tax=Gymnopus androsaceus JB14 TaxID=1447944 RepID=A0A6A4H8H6_9AGAR|nr:hypothetical protein BT96DRAFT_998434 [Gymnopus androsaceus JB14]
MSLYLHISTLLAIGNQTDVQFLVLLRMLDSMLAKAKDIQTTSQRTSPRQGGNDKGMDSPTGEPRNSKDLKNFQHFIHHRAYRKLGWRVLDFSTHWGKLPFDIISKCLAKSELESKDFTFKEVFNNAIQMHMPSRASSETNSKPVYCLNSDNALQWLNVVYTLWETLQKKLLGEGKPKLREIKTPTPEAVCEIVYALMGLEAMMPVLKHLLSAEGVVGALAENELLAYLSRTAKSSGDKSLAPDTDGGDGDERVEPDTD